MHLFYIDLKSAVLMFNALGVSWSINIDVVLISVCIRWNIAKAAVTQIVNSLSRDDRVNIICSKGDFIDSGGYQRRATPIILGCNKKGMMRATPSNRAQLLESLNEQSPYGSGEEHMYVHAFALC